MLNLLLLSFVRRRQSDEVLESKTCAPGMFWTLKSLRYFSLFLPFFKGRCLWQAGAQWEAAGSSPGVRMVWSPSQKILRDFISSGSYSSDAAQLLGVHPAAVKG